MTTQARMSMAFPLTGGPHRDPRELIRWGVSFAAILALHAGVVMYALARHEPAPADTEAAPILVDLSPLVTPEAEAASEATPGPEATEASAPDPSPETEEVEEDETPPMAEDIPLETPPDVPPAESILPPTPKVVKKAEVSLPPPPKPKPPRPKPERKPPPKPPEVRKPVRPPSVKRVESKAPPAPRASARTSAPGGRRGQPSAASSAVGGQASGAEMASWHSRLVAHIQRHKRYPAGARDSGTAVVAFVMDRNGRVLSRRLAGSSGSAALDRETLDLIARAQPLPRPPANAAQSVFQFAIPIRYSLR